MIFKHLSSAIAAAMLLAACAPGYDNVRDFEASQDSVESLIDRARIAYAATQNGPARTRLQSASRLAKSDTENFFFANNFYQYLASEAAIAWLDLEDGNAAGAERRYDSLAQEITRLERERSQLAAEKGIESRNFAAAVGALYAFERIYRASGSLASSGQVAANAALQVLQTDFTLKGTPSISQQDDIDRDIRRFVAIPSMGPLTQIGRLVFSDGGHCTASLIGEALALTNAHCVVALNKGARGSLAPGLYTPKRADMQILFEGLYLPDRVRVNDVVLPDEGGRAWRIGANSVDDWAILRLDRHPIGRGYFGIEPGDKPLMEGESVVLAGHSSDLNDGRFLTVDWNCPVLESGDKVIYQCLRASGASGSPVFRVGARQELTHIVSLHAFGRAGEAWGGGPRSDQFIEAVRRMR